MPHAIFPQKNIVVLGAGFGGLTAARILGKALRDDAALRNEYDIVLIDKKDAHTYTPGLYEVASLLREDASPIMLKHTAAIAIEDSLSGLPVRFLCDEVLHVQLPDGASGNSEIVTPFTIMLRDTRALYAHYLILALGSVTNDFGVTGVRDHAFSLKTFEDALYIRSQLTPILKERLDVRVLIAGGGATGVELAGELAGLSRRITRITKTPRNHHLLLVEAGPRILAGSPDAIASRAMQRLSSLGISIRLQNRITEVHTHEAIVTTAEGKKEALPFDIFVWSGGIQPNPILNNIILPKDQRGRCMVDLDLSVHGFHNLFAVGDLTCFASPKDGKPLPATAYIAINEGKVAARNVLLHIRGKGFAHYHPPARPPFIVPIRGKWAIAYVFGLTFTGIFAFILRLLIDLRYFARTLPLRKALKFFWFSTLVYFKND